MLRRERDLQVEVAICLLRWTKTPIVLPSIQPRIHA
jgi:hypothetical protein